MEEDGDASSELPSSKTFARAGTSSWTFIHRRVFDFMENPDYMEAISASGPLLLDDETALVGDTTLSIETIGEGEQQGIYSFILENVGAFYPGAKYYQHEKTLANLWLVFR